ncbi:MAG: hypothetical protein ACRC0A_06120 [Chitinophagaceae bacterium]
MIFIQGTSKNSDGKLRFLSECNPMAFIAEQAGIATDGINYILDIMPT